MMRMRCADRGRAVRSRQAGLACCLVLAFAGRAFSEDFIRVPERQSYTDVKAGPSSGSIVLVLVPSGTVLPIVKRQGEWLQVRLAPDLRRRGIPMRWYKNEELGFVHESTVEIVKNGPPASTTEGAPGSQAPGEYVRVPPRQTNTDIKAGPGSGSIVLLLVPSGTVLPVLGQRGEWVQVRLSPELRRVGTPMRWYKNEETGFVHESTVERFTKQ